MYHYRKTRKHYRKHLHAPECPFCSEEVNERIIAEGKYTYIIPNLTSYDLWELTEVVEHLMIIPRRHVGNLKGLTKAERMELIDTIADYESRGYNVYARTPTSTSRSVTHQHTHLIRTNGTRARASFFLKKPYFLFKFK